MTKQSKTPSSSNPAKIDRSTAAKINPLISDVYTEDTLERVSAVLRDLAVIQSYQEEENIEIPTSKMHLILALLAAALEYEIKNPRLESQTKKGAKRA